MGVFSTVICNVIWALIVLNLAAVYSADVANGSADGSGAVVVATAVAVNIINVGLHSGRLWRCLKILV